ncbi:MAG: NAD(P)-dependent oxidoreductase [Myxococcota bacterium]|nr:NAD(P)-dependent oxidoreductase [Myxococcota bacterium]
MGSRIFVTGANGRVGMPLIRALVSEGHQVIGLARNDEKAGVVRALGAECLVGDLSSTDVLTKGADGAERIYHLAGGVRGKGQETPDVINSQGTASLIEAIGRADTASLDSVLFTSTCAIYGDRSNLWVPEDMTPTPNTRYGKSKLAAEEALLSSGLPVRIVRLAAVYGPGFPFMMVERMQAGKGWLPGEGRNYIPTVHIDDAVEGLKCIDSAGKPGEIYHLADQEPLLLKEFYAEVHKLSGGEPLKFWSTWVPSYVQRSAARYNERLQSRINRRPQFTPDNLKLYTNSVRLKVERLEKELSFTWKYPNAASGLAATLQG